MTVTAAEQALRDKGIRVTSERIHLYEVLTKNRKPLASKDIHALLGKDADRVTVYRTLETFVEVGLARRVDIGHRHAHYELILDEHHHLICTVCGRIEDVAFCPDPAAIKKMLKESKHFAEVTSHALEFYGRCTSCAKK
jgi:Fur family ferric uptake transcriptional regulator